jgi:hypothetical protein
MTDVTIKNVPDGAEEKVKELAMVAIERFLRERDVKVTEQVISKFEADVDLIREDNSLTAKFVKLKEDEIINEPIKDIK